MLIDFRERGREREEERERMRKRNIHVREKHPSVAFHTHPYQGSNPQPFGVPDDAPLN